MVATSLPWDPLLQVYFSSVLSKFTFFILNISIQVTGDQVIINLIHNFSLGKKNALIER